MNHIIHMRTIMAAYPTILASYTISLSLCIALIVTTEGHMRQYALAIC